MTEVQPVFDKHCVSCHDYGKESGKKLNLAGDAGLIFSTSYVELRSKNYVRVAGAGPSTVLQPRSWGSYVSPLVDVLLSGHKHQRIDKSMKIDKQSFDRIVTWIDINAPYYPDYASAYPDNTYGRSPLAPARLERLSELTGIDLNDQKFSSHVSFNRPEQSPCLDQWEHQGDPRYEEALSIIRGGAELLARRPRADMPGFRLAGTDAERQAKYTQLVEKKAKPQKAVHEQAGENCLEPKHLQLQRDN